MVSKIKAVIFDLDNTLLDFVEAKLKTCKAVIEHLGLKEDEHELLNYFLREVHDFEDVRNIADYMMDRGVYSDARYRECCEIYER